MCVPCFVVQNFVPFIVLGGKERAGCFTLFVFQVSCEFYCTVTLPHGAMGWSALCDCGIFRVILTYYMVNITSIAFE